MNLKTYISASFSSQWTRKEGSLAVSMEGKKGSETEVAQSSLTLCDPRDCSLPGSSGLGFSRQEYWSGLPFPFPGESSQPRDQTQVSHIAGRLFTISATRESPYEWKDISKLIKDNWNYFFF